MTESLRFDNRVVVITGAGSGLGKSYALEFGKRGAKVVVNDLGGSRNGEGKSSKAADEVVEEIKRNGGTAVANYDSVEFGEKIIETALKAFGRVDVIINNAGILRDTSMLKMTNNDWDLIMNIHLKGAFTVTKAAWKHMRDNKYGRIINTSSGSGLYGSFGQANYSAAKMGLHGFTNTLTKEGSKYGINVNTIVPIASSRMTEDLFPPEIQKIMSPDKIVPLVVYLCHESSQETGGLFESVGGWYAKLRLQRTQGEYIPGNVTAEQIKKSWNNSVSFDKTNHYPADNTETIQLVMKLVETKPKI